MIVALLVVSATAAQAQWYIEGSASGKYEKSSSNYVVKNQWIGVYPAVGYRFNDRFDTGITLGYFYRNNKSQGSTYREETAEEWSVSPYVRYSFIRLGKFSVAGLLSARYVQGETKDEYYMEDSYLYTETDYTIWGARLTPQLLFKASKHLDFLASLNFASLNYSVFDEKDTGRQTSYEFGVNSSNVFNTGNFQVGFIYKF